MQITDLKIQSILELNEACASIRDFLINSVSQTGGHLAPNLGVVELTVALHRVFNTPTDKIVWDVGHQSYVHKILTGRGGEFSSLRQKNGLSGFPKIGESKHDAFGTGHASTSISAGLGIAAARDLNRQDFQVISVIGDGSLTGGIAFEGLNQLGYLQKDMIVILNDNKMSISMNVGALSNYTERIKQTERYKDIKEKINIIIKECKSTHAQELKQSLKEVLNPGVIFEKLGINYLGPIDGHNVEEVIKTLEKAKTIKGPKLVHVITKKGKGYACAENNSCKFHGVSPFNIPNGDAKSKSSSLTYTKAFSHAMLSLAKNNEKIVGITAAMPDGTGLNDFARVFPKRFFDVGIAEQHAVTFAAGLATLGIKPVVAIYSTFLQRAFDQVIHDVCLQKLPIIFALDRAGLVGEDGPTHHGSFDLSYLRLIPNLIISAPKDEQELCDMLYTASITNLPFAIRYPRGGSGLIANTDSLQLNQEIPIGEAEIIQEGSEIILLGIGSTVDLCTKASDQLKKENNINAKVINTRFIKPLDKKIIESIIKVKKAVIVEENSCIGGLYGAVTEQICAQDMADIKIKQIALPDKFVEHGNAGELKKDNNLSVKSIVASVKEIICQ